jgi:hypothetical protein
MPTALIQINDGFKPCDPNAALNCGYSRALAAFDDRPAAHLRRAQS